jgi:hypothetical protein
MSNITPDNPPGRDNKDGYAEGDGDEEGDTIRQAKSKFTTNYLSTFVPAD